MELYIVGTGMDGDMTLTEEAKKIISCAEVLIGARRMTAPYEQSGRRVLTSYDADEICRFVSAGGYDSAAVLMSGDCGFFSGARRFLARHEFAGARVVPGIATPVYLCSKTGHSWEKMKFVSLHGRRGNIAVNVLMNRLCCFILGGDTDAAGLCRQLCSYGLPDVRVWVGEQLAGKNERITCGYAHELTDIASDKLSAVIVENDSFLSSVPECIPDERFERGKVPMTKAEVRCISAAKLGIDRDSICWDVGCGTGSVTVEMAMKCPDGRVYAFDKSQEAVELTKKNAARFSCDNIIVSSAVLPCGGLPAPDKVFIGGSGGKLREIIRLALSLNPSADIVITAVSLETLGTAAETLSQEGLSADIIQVSVTRTGKLGGSTMLRALNPIFVIKGERS